jgi:glycosyltransferase involved in cell wall biosynthesis
MTPDLSIVIPVRNESPNIKPLYDELTTTLVRGGRSYEILVIDDGSTDDTFEQLAALQSRDPHLRVIRFRRNFGQTAAFAAGFAYARGRLVVTADGDLQNDPADILRLVAMAGQADIVCGWRRRRKDAFLTRHVPSVVANWLIGAVTGVALHDNGCSLKVFRADAVKPLQLEPGMHRYLPAIAGQLGGRVVEAEVHHRPRRFGRSKYGLSRTFRVLTDLFRLRPLMRRAVIRPPSAPPLYDVAEVLLPRQV